MNEELIEKFKPLLDVADMDCGAQFDLTLIDDGIYKFDISIVKVGDNEYSFGYAVLFGDIVKHKLECGINSFRGDIKVLLVGFLKSLLRINTINDTSSLFVSITNAIAYISKTISPVTKDESKVNIEKWKIPTIIKKDYLH